MKLRKFQSVLLAASGILVCGVPALQAAETTIGGVVRDANGVPQMDVLVQLLSPESAILQTVRTDDHGRYVLAGVLPGLYQLKAIETSFLPTLRENLRVGVKARVEANLTLSTLMDALQWLPAQTRKPTESEDDWKWTLRSAAYRPLLRFVGPDDLETIDMPESHASTRHGRVLIESGPREFGEGGVTTSVAYRHDGSEGTSSLVNARVGDARSATTSLMAAYGRQSPMDTGLATVISFEGSPQIQDGAARGMNTVRLRSSDRIRFSPEMTAEVGNQLNLVSLGNSTFTTAEPFARLQWAHGDLTAQYLVTTSPQLAGGQSFSDPDTLLNRASMRDGVLALEHGLHQELRLEKANDTMTATVAIYADSVRNPYVDATGASAVISPASGNVLYDGETGMERAAASDYNADGVMVSVSRKGPADTRATLAYASGRALAVTSGGDVITGVPPIRTEGAQSVSMLVEGGSTRSGTDWRASYRWQPNSTVNAVDLFDSGMADAYLSVFLKQSLHVGRVFPGGVDAVVNVRNLLAQGYHPFLTSDGSTIFFAQVDRSVQGGLAFYF